MRQSRRARRQTDSGGTQYAARKAAQTAVVERKRKDGEDIGTVHGMSKKGDELRAQYMAREKRK